MGLGRVPRRRGQAAAASGTRAAPPQPGSRRFLLGTRVDALLGAALTTATCRRAVSWERRYAALLSSLRSSTRIPPNARTHRRESRPPPRTHASLVLRSEGCRMKAKVASRTGGDRLAVKKGGKAEKDPNKPKRPPSAFFVFMEGFRKEYKEKYPNNKQVSVVGKAGGEKWKSLTDVLIMPCFQFLTKFVEQIHAIELLKLICKKIIRKSLTLKEAPVPTYDSRSSYLHCDVNKHCHIWWSGGESKDALLASLGICYQLTGMKRSEI